MTESDDHPIYSVVLAGGVGSRFWPASRPHRPKQLLPLGEDGRPLVTEAVERARAVAGPGRVRVVAGAHLLPQLREALPELDGEHFLVEPRPRGTGPALAWAAHHVAGIAPRAVMLSLHADHRISSTEAFLETVRRTVRAVRPGGRLFSIGVPPDRPATGYGYLRLGAELAEGVYEALEFVEKPSRETAEDYLASGAYLWNTGIFAWRVDDFLRVVRSRTPELSGSLPHLEEGEVEAFFDSVEPVSVDVGVMERAPEMGAVRAGFVWDDLGVWPALARVFPGDGDGNVVRGPAELVEAADNVVWSEDGRIVLFGVDNLVVARSGGETLVTTREHAPRLKELLARLEEEGSTSVPEGPGTEASPTGDDETREEPAG